MMRTKLTNKSSGLAGKSHPKSNPKFHPRKTPPSQPSSSFFFLLIYEDEYMLRLEVDSRTGNDKHEIIFDKENSKVTFCGCKGFKYSKEMPKKCAHAYELYKHQGIDPEKKVWPWLYLLPF